MRARLFLLVLIALLIIVGAPLVGMEKLSFREILDFDMTTPAAIIFFKIRLPRVIAAFLAGAGLAVGGAAFQSVFRNPLATPFTLGVASGAAFGVAIVSRVGFSFNSAIPFHSIGALAGAGLAIGTVWFITRLRPAFSATALLLAGVAMSFLFSSLILFLQYTASLGDSYRIVRWLMGGLGGVDNRALVSMAPFVIVGVGGILFFVRELDLLAAGTDIAASRGVEVTRVRKMVFFATSVMVGGVVAVCGPIGFVGMMAPHICRLIVGVDHRRLLPAAALFGGAFLVVCDTGARTLMAPVELPVGVITAFLGGPFFLWLLLRRGGLR